MTCVNCSNGIEKAVNKLDGLLSSKVSFASNEGEFEIENKLLDKEVLFNKIRKLGYGVEEDLKALEKSKLIAYNKLKYNLRPLNIPCQVNSDRRNPITPELKF